MNRLSALPRAILGRPISACRATRFLATVARPARLGAGVPRAPMVGLTTPSTPAIGARFRTTDASETADGPFAVVSLMGKDRKGIVRDFSSLLSKMGANVEESRMSRLGGTFAVIVLVVRTELLFYRSSW